MTYFLVTLRYQYKFNSSEITRKYIVEGSGTIDVMDRVTDVLMRRIGVLNESIFVSWHVKSFNQLFNNRFIVDII